MPLAEAHGEEEHEPSCLGDSQHAVLHYLWQGNLPIATSQTLALPTKQMEQIRDSQARLHLNWLSPQEAENYELAQFSFSLPLPPNQFGLPYTVYAIEISWKDAGYTHGVFYDYTNNCNAGRSYFPRSILQLDPLSIPAAAKDLEVKVWGQRI